MRGYRVEDVILGRLGHEAHGLRRPHIADVHHGQLVLAAELDLFQGIGFKVVVQGLGCGVERFGVRGLGFRV